MRGDLSVICESRNKLAKIDKQILYSSLSNTSFLNEPSSFSPSRMDRTCDVDEGEEMEMKACSEKVVETHEEKDDTQISSNQITDLQMYRINDPAYLVSHSAKYTLPPHQDPKLAPLNLRDQVKVICSYHASISRSIANLAKLQVECCNYPAPINPATDKSDSGINQDILASEVSKGGNIPNHCEEYVSRAGRITKRKFYLESDIDLNKGSSQGILESSLQDDLFSPKGNSDDESNTKKKAPLTSPKSRNLRPKQLKLDTPEEEVESKKKAGSKSSPSCTVTRQKRSADGFVKPTTPSSNKKTIRKTVQCPICSLDFPEKEVEQHASSCGEISAEIERLIDTPSDNTGFRCHSCRKMMTSPEAYESHRSMCNGGPSYL